ncbi:MAG: D-alanyl-D-alanine carboxypeptidase family protein [Minisyncoccia bacterium]
MKNNIKFFLAGFFISSLIFSFLNFFYNNNSSKIKENLGIRDQTIIKGEISANIQKSENFNDKKINISEIKNYPEISATSAISLKLSNDIEEIIFQKNINQKLPIASLTKLMSAIIAVEFLNPQETIKIDEEIINQPESIGELKIGDILNRDELLEIMLLESSNDAAFAIAKIIGVDGFLQLMNWKAKELSMENTYFFNPTGIDEEKTNYSTVFDLTKLAKEIIKQKEIMDILSKKEYPLYLSNGIFHHTLKNTNELLGEIPGIIGGKTGYTEKAKGCLLEIMKAKENGKNIFIINIILGSNDRFTDMRKIINFLNENFNFEY